MTDTKPKTIAEKKAEYQRKYRQKQRQKLGNEAYKKKEAESRKARRHKKNPPKIISSKEVKSIEPNKEAKKYEQVMKPVVQQVQNTIQQATNDYVKNKTVKPINITNVQKVYNKALVTVDSFDTKEQLIKILYQFEKGADGLKKKNPRESTIKTNLRRIEIIFEDMHKNKKMNYTNDDIMFLENHKKVIQFITNDNKNIKSVNSKKSYFSSIAAVTRWITDLQHTHTFYTKAMDVYYKKDMDVKLDNVLNKTEKENWIPLTQLRGHYRNMIKNKGTLRELALYDLYVSNKGVRRLEFTRFLTVLYIQKMQHLEQILKNVDKERNYVVMNKGEINQIILYKYKRSDTKGDYRMKPIPQIIRTSLERYIKNDNIQDNQFVFHKQNNKNEQLKNSQELADIFKKYTGKNISVNLLRKIYISHVYEKGNNKLSQKEINRLAQDMDHTPRTSNIYYKKIDA